MLESGLGGGALLLADDANALAAEAAEAADQRFVLTELAVAGERGEFGDQCVDVIDQMRPRWPTRHLCLLPRRQVGIQIDQRLRGALLDACDLVTDVAAAGRERAQFVELGIEFGDRLFEIEIASHCDPV
jgi:hypothetical protein